MTTAAAPLMPVPDRLVVLTFDDAVSNHATFVAPLLKKYGFGGTFFICEFPPDFATNKQQYMTWEQVRGLHEMGFEVGNHTGHHTAVKGLSREKLLEEVQYLEDRCREHDIPTPTSFCYPGNVTAPEALPILIERGFRFARYGGERPYRPGDDHPLLIPSLAAHGDDEKPFFAAVQQARDRQIPVLMFHGVPEHTHPWVNTPPELFERHMRYLHDNDFTAIAMGDLHRYVHGRQ